MLTYLCDKAPSGVDFSRDAGADGRLSDPSPDVDELPFDADLDVVNEVFVCDNDRAVEQIGDGFAGVKGDVRRPDLRKRPRGAVWVVEDELHAER